MNEFSIYEQLNELYSNVKLEDRSEKLRDLFYFLKKFPKIAPFNLALVAAQRPGARFFANNREWFKLGRRVKPEARPLITLRLFGPVEFVYDVSDTFGDTLPEEIENPFRIKRAAFSSQEYDHLVSQLCRVGVKYVLGEFGSQQGGCIELLPRPEYYSISDKEEVCLFFQMTVSSRLSDLEKYSTIAHELGHLFCGHLGAVDKKSWPSRRDLTLNQREFEAESVRWLICERRGIKNPSEYYLHGYLDEGQQIPDVDLGCILRAVTNIESMLRGRFLPLEALLRNKNQNQPELDLFK